MEGGENDLGLGALGCPRRGGAFCSRANVARSFDHEQRLRFTRPRLGPGGRGKSRPRPRLRPGLGKGATRACVVGRFCGAGPRTRTWAATVSSCLGQMNSEL